MSPSKKKPTPMAPPERLDVIILCDRCPGHRRVRDDSREGNGKIYTSNYQCPECREHFLSNVKTLTADTGEANNKLGTREPLLHKYRLDVAKKTIETKDREIEKLKDQVRNYERAMALMGGGMMRSPFGMSY